MPSQAPRPRTNPFARPRPSRRRGPRAGTWARAALAITFFFSTGSLPGIARSQPVVSASSDVTIDLGAGVVAADDDVSVDNQLGIVLLEGLGGLPSQTDVVAYGQELGGVRLFAVDTTVDLGGLVARRGDVVRWNGQSYSIAFDASAEGVPTGAVVDAVSLAPGGYLLSFDTTVDLGSGVVAHDEDLVRWSSSTGAFTIVLSGAAIGIPRALDVDGAQDLGGGAFLLSFDTAGTVLGVTFDDDDVLRLEGGVLTVEFDGSAAHAAWGAADLDAVLVPEPGVAIGLLMGACALGRWARRRPRTSRLAAGLTTFIAAGVAGAVDGVQEVNQTCAVQTGCFSGDSPGFPVTIDGAAGNSYRLTSDLVTPSVNVSGVLVLADRITVDLGGFELTRSDCRGQETCPVVPGIAVAGIGVPQLTGGTTAHEVTVRNGVIRGMGGWGVRVDERAHVHDLAISSCAGGISTSAGSRIHDNVSEGNDSVGIVAGRGSTVRDNVARLNGDIGILVDTGSILIGNTTHENQGDGLRATGSAVARRNTAILNTGDGLDLGTNATATGNLARSNDGVGIRAGAGSHLSGNTANTNGGSGIEAGDGSVLEGNLARNNGATGMFLGVAVTVRGSSATDNTGDGIFVSSGSTVTDNAAHGNGGDGIQAGTDSLVHRNNARLNGGYGLQLSAGSGYRENVVNDNTTGTVLSGVNLGNNVCNGNTTCP
ncbi:MAG TPA: right-handed parallel beta-helix repeat-containing protein [Myxococcota bacterium]|nr:right-handed parallel beta-helix repeat-containing protein [Myxococcota bacterium]